MTKPVPGAKKYMQPAERKQQIFDEAWRQAVTNGLRQVTASSVARELTISAPMVNIHYGKVSELRRLLVEHAIAERNADVLADALAMGLPVVGASDTLLKRAWKLANAA